MPKAKTEFIRTLRASFSTHPTLDTLWSLLLGEVVPTPAQQQILLDHFRSYGFEVLPRDFVRGTAASNNPIFINLRLLRRSLDRSSLELLFFSNRQLRKELPNHADKQA